jgi:Archaeal holliday junction resolvase (hjc)
MTTATKTRAGTSPRLRYRQGADLELAVKHHLQDNGYYVVKSAGSKGAVDLVALKRGEVLVIQCKTDGYVPPAERMTFRSLAVSVGATCLIGRWHKEGRAARAVAFQELTADGGGTAPWTPDHGLEAVAGA